VTAENNPVPSLYEWLGGAEVLKALMVKFYDRVSMDELLRPLFGEMPTDHPQHVADFVGEVMGGSQTYSISRGGTRPCWRITSGEIFRKDNAVGGWACCLTAQMRSGFPATLNFGQRWWHTSSGGRDSQS